MTTNLAALELKDQLRAYLIAHGIHLNEDGTVRSVNGFEPITPSAKCRHSAKPFDQYTSTEAAFVERVEIRHMRCWIKPGAEDADFFATRYKFDGAHYSLAPDFIAVRNDNTLLLFLVLNWSGLEKFYERQARIDAWCEMTQSLRKQGLVELIDMVC